MYEFDLDPTTVTLGAVTGLLDKRFAPSKALKFTQYRQVHDDVINPVFAIPKALDFDPKEMDEAIASMAKHTGINIFRMVTGAGKSTVVPIRLTVHFKRVLVVEPNDLLAISVYSYMSKVHPGKIHRKECKPGVTYMSAPDMLMELVNGSLNMPDALILDEAHTRMAEYEAIIAWSLLHWQSIPIYLLSATLGGPLVFTDTRFPIFEQEIEIGTTMSSLVEAVTSGMFSRKTVKDRTMLIVPDNKAAKIVHDIYVQYGVPVISYCDGDTFETFTMVQKFLSKTTPRVLVCTPVLTTGITLPLETVWDFSMQVDYDLSYEPLRFSRVWKPCSSAERRQRIGRVGRLAVGAAVTNTLDRPLDNELSNMQLCRLVCWLNLLGIKPDPDLARHTARLFPLTPECAALSLMFATHPIIMRRFFSPDGSVYGNYEGMVKFLLPTWTVSKSRLWLETDESAWEKDYRLDFRIPLTFDSVDSCVFIAIAKYSLGADYTKKQQIVTPEQYWSVTNLSEESDDDEEISLEVIDRGSVATITRSPPIKKSGVQFGTKRVLSSKSENSTILEPIVVVNETKDLLLAKQKIWPKLVTGTVTASSYHPTEDSLVYRILRQADVEVQFESLNPVSQKIFAQDFAWFWNEHLTAYSLVDQPRNFWDRFKRKEKPYSKTQRLLGIYYKYLDSVAFTAV